MSGKQYLFFTFAGLLLLLALGQGLFLNIITGHISERIGFDSKALSKQLIEFAADNVIKQHNANELHELIESVDVKEALKSEQIFELDNRVVIVRAQSVNEQTVSDPALAHRYLHKKLSQSNGDSTVVVIENEEVCQYDKHGQLQGDAPKSCAKTLAKARGSKDGHRSELLIKRLHDSLDEIDIHVKKISHGNKVMQVTEDSINVMPFTRTVEFKSSALELMTTLQRWNFYIIAFFALIGLGFAYLISHRFSQPLKLLSKGYEQVGQGDFKTRLEVHGVSEVKKVIKGFNEMASQIESYQERESSLKDRAYLTELGEVARGVAHALRNPIHTLGLAVDKLSGRSQNADEQPTLDAMKDKLNTMDKTIQSLLTLTASGIDRNQSVNIYNVIQDIILEVKTASENTMRFKLDVDKNASLSGSETELRNMLHALIINAVEASEEQDQIEIALYPQEQKTCLSVCDHGPGLSEAIKQRLFEPHVTSKAEGTGMGLYITQRLAKLFYDAELVLENKADRGCCAILMFNHTS